MSLSTLLRQHLTALRALLVGTVVLGIAYPVAVTAVAQLPGLRHHADGSLLRGNGRVVGSSLIGQAFTTKDGAPLPQYFQSRPSAAGNGYDPTASGASNLGPESTELLQLICQRSAAVGRLEGVSGARPGCPDGGPAVVPPDAVTASGSGLDPDISPAYATLQVPRIARERSMSVAQVKGLIDRYTTEPAWGFLGAPAVNVLQLNLALDRTHPM